MILTLDPSSTIIGYAIWEDDGTLYEYGLITPDKSSAPANDRIKSMTREVLNVLPRHRKWTVVVEDVGKHVNHGRNKGNGAGLATYGKAVGYLVGALDYCAAAESPFGIARIVLVEPAVWTREKKKATRLQVVKVLHPEYDPTQDKGGDAGDAIGIGDWYFATRSLPQ